MRAKSHLTIVVPVDDNLKTFSANDSRGPTARLVWTLAVLLAAACGEPVRPAAEVGAELFRDPRLSESEFNTYSCATCHATVAEPGPEVRNAGYTLYDSAFRESWWGGYEVRLLDAVNVCYVSFMRGVAPLATDEPKSRALYEYLVSLSPSPRAPALPFTVVRDIVDVPRGDPGRGEAVYRAACQVCHGAMHTGAGRLGELVPTLPQVTQEYGQLFPGVPPGLVVIEKVRHGRFFGVGGTMPPYSLEALSNEELAALLAFLGL